MAEQRPPMIGDRRADDGLSEARKRNRPCPVELGEGNARVRRRTTTAHSSASHDGIERVETRKRLKQNGSVQFMKCILFSIRVLAVDLLRATSHPRKEKIFITAN